MLGHVACIFQFSVLLINKFQSNEEDKKCFEEFFINDLKSMKKSYLVTSFFVHVLMSLMRIKEDNLRNISTKTLEKYY